MCNLKSQCRNQVYTYMTFFIKKNYLKNKLSDCSITIYKNKIKKSMKFEYSNILINTSHKTIKYMFNIKLKINKILHIIINYNYL